jgi:hypothetical protein
MANCCNDLIAEVNDRWLCRGKYTLDAVDQLIHRRSRHIEINDGIRVELMFTLVRRELVQPTADFFERREKSGGVLHRPPRSSDQELDPFGCKHCDVARARGLGPSSVRQSTSPTARRSILPTAAPTRDPRFNDFSLCVCVMPPLLRASSRRRMTSVGNPRISRSAAGRLLST